MLKKADLKRINNWRINPKEWVKFLFGDNIKKLKGIQTETGLSTQQENALIELGKLVNAKLKLARKEELTKEEIIYSRKRGISIMSGQGTGKDFIAALINMWFQYCFPNPKGMCTANTDKQLKNVLWSEFSKIMSLSRKISTEEGAPTELEFLFTWQSEKIFLKEKKGQRWFIEAVTVNVNAGEKEQAETLGGRHEKYMLITVDEASGLPEPVFRPLEGATTDVLNIALIIFNPTRSRGYAIDTQTTNKGRWIALRWNSEESELVSKEHIRDMEDTHGRDSNMYRIRILGLPPISEKDALIPIDWIEDAVDRPLTPLFDDPIIKGLDCGAGGDDSVICTRHGGKVLSFKKNNTSDSMQLVGWAVMNYYNEEPDIFLYDVIGIGYGIGGRLREQVGFKVKPFDSRAKPLNQDKFVNKRDETYWNLRTAFENNSISICKNEELILQLSSLRFDIVDSNGKIKIISKKKIKNEIGHSPDECDSLMITYAYPDRMFRKNKNTVNQKYKIQKYEDKSLSWMVA